MNSSNTVLSVFNLSPRRIGGIETMARELSVQLGERGWRSVLCFRAEPTKAVRCFLQLPNVSIHWIDDMRRWSWACQRQLVNLMDRCRPSVAHFNFVDLFGPFAAVARLRGVPRIFYTDHISRQEDYSSRRSRWLKRAAYRVAVPVTKVFCVSDFVRQFWLDSEQLPANRFATVYNGVNVDRCARSLEKRELFRARHSLPEDSIVVTQIGSLINEKGVATMLEAARIVIAAGPQVVFVLAGDGKHRDEYCRSAERLGLGGRVRFLGLVDDPVGEGLFAASDIICQPSNWHEAFGLSIAEAMACERPVVATRVGGIPELVQHLKTGILVERGDSAALAASILKLVGFPELRRTYGDAGRQYCRAHFDHRANVARMIEFYELPALGEGATQQPALAG